MALIQHEEMGYFGLVKVDIVSYTGSVFNQKSTINLSLLILLPSNDYKLSLEETVCYDRIRNIPLLFKRMLAILLSSCYRQTVISQQLHGPPRNKESFVLLPTAPLLLKCLFLEAPLVSTFEGGCVGWRHR